LTKLDNNETVNHIFLGVRAAVAAMILLSAVKLAKQALKSRWAQAIAIFGFIAMVFFEMNAILLVVIGAVVGLAIAYLPMLFNRRKPEEHPAK
ncbi:MAG: chromate transporter, partial [Victivallales bacterium]|nr:chromate transporter [Victivallales bacterium]